MSRGTILVIEDQPILRLILEKELVKAGFEVFALESGEGALKTLEKLTPDLILLNIMLTGIDGIEVCRRVRADSRLERIPVIFLTAKKDPESRATCLSVGANDYVIKPWESEDLILRIGNAIARESHR